MSLNAEALLASKDLTVELVKTPEWGGDVYVRSMQGRELGVFSKLLKGTREVQEFPIEAVATVCALSLCDEKGTRLFPDHEKGQKQLSEKNASVLQRVFEVAMRLSSLTGDKSAGKT